MEIKKNYEEELESIRQKNRVEFYAKRYGLSLRLTKFLLKRNLLKKYVSIFKNVSL